MATVDKLNYLLETKVKIKDAINNDISLIDENTIFREYSNKIKSLSDTLKSYIPTDIKIGAGIQVNDAVPLNAKSLIIDGNSYQKTTKGKNLYDINDLAQLSSTEVIDDYIDITFDNSQGSKTRYLEFHSKVSSLIKPSTNYTVIAEILEVSGDGTLRLNSTSEGQNVSQFSIGTNYSFQNLSKGQLIFYPVTALDNFDNAIRGLRSNAYFTTGQIGSLKIRISIIEGEVTQDNFEYEPFTGGIASPNPNSPQETDVIDSVNIINRSNQLVDFSKNSDLTAGTTFYFENDVLNISCSNNKYSCVRYDILEIIKNNPSKILSFVCENYDFTNGNNPIVQIKYKLNEIIKYKVLFNDSKNKFSFIIPENIDDITSAELEIFSNNTGSITDSSISITKPILQFGTDKLEYDSYHKDEYSVDLQGNFIAKINDIKDTLDLATGFLNKNVGLKVLNGSENWTSVSAYEGYYRYSLELNNENLISNVANGLYTLNTHFHNRNLENHGDYEYLYFQTNVRGGIIYIQSKKWSTVDDFKNWLSENNVVAYYQLINPQIIQLDPLKIKMYEGTNNIELTSNLETSMKLEYYKDYKLDTNDIEQNEIIE